MKRIVLDCIHADTCLPDYWGGHHLAHVQILPWAGMSGKDIREELRHELNQGAVMGNDERTRDDSGDIGDAWYKAAHAAVQRLKPAIKGQRRFFTDLDSDNEDSDVYAYFVFVDRAD